ncbi:hypothetical protein [Streptomyces sp. Ag82_O1-15]|nr:hypothetical protein [Streptomyces sp. Ag82_O1-15]
MQGWNTASSPVGDVSDCHHVKVLTEPAAVAHRQEHRAALATR